MLLWFRSSWPEGTRRLMGRICIDISAATRQGAGMARYSICLVTSLARLVDPASLLLFHNRQASTRIPDELAAFRHVSVGFSNRMWRMRILASEVLGVGAMDARFSGVDVFHGANSLLPTLKALPTVLTVPDLSFITHPWFHTPLNALNLQLQVPRWAAGASRIIALSESTKRDLLSKLSIPEEKIVVTALGVDSSFRRRADTAEVTDVLARYGVSQPFILSVGTIEPRKNLSTLLKALEAMPPPIREPYQLVIVGCLGWKFGKLIDQIKSSPLSGKIKRLGYLPDDDLAAMYSGADLFVFPSFYEGFGLPVLEAMACGCPVVASSSSSIPEVAGDAAILIDPTDHLALAAAMKQVLEDPRLARRLSEAGTLRSARYTWDRTARETLAVYQNLIPRSS
jgi:glycosyltransferase involved in cell wall biosynthesis